LGDGEKSKVQGSRFEVRGLRRCGGEVTGAELAGDFGEGEADAVAVGKRRRGVKLELGKLEAGGGEERAKAGGFGGELRGVGEVLELASAARAEVGAGGHGAPARFEAQGSRFEGCGHLQASSWWGM
jgi:hypothetical protein